MKVSHRQHVADRKTFSLGLWPTCVKLIWVAEEYFYLLAVWQENGSSSRSTKWTRTKLKLCVGQFIRSFLSLWLQDLLFICNVVFLSRTTCGHTAPCRKAELVAQIAGCNFRGKHVGVTARATQRPEAAQPGGARRLCASHKHLIWPGFTSDWVLWYFKSGHGTSCSVFRVRIRKHADGMI